MPPKDRVRQALETEAWLTLLSTAEPDPVFT